MCGGQGELAAAGECDDEQHLPVSPSRDHKSSHWSIMTFEKMNSMIVAAYIRRWHLVPWNVLGNIAQDPCEVPKTI
jgi:hypothetical protein